MMLSYYFINGLRGKLSGLNVLAKSNIAFFIDLSVNISLSDGYL